MRDIFYYADLFSIVLLLILVTVFVVRAVRSGVRGRRIAGAWAYFFGTFITVALAFHVAENIWRIIPGTPVTDAVKPEYDFRFYALVLFGVVMLVQGTAIMKAARALTFGEETARAALVRHTFIVLALVVPLIPIQIFASMITLIGVLNLTALALLARGKVSAAERSVLPVNALLESR